MSRLRVRIMGSFLAAATGLLIVLASVAAPAGADSSSTTTTAAGATTSTQAPSTSTTEATAISSTLATTTTTAAPVPTASTQPASSTPTTTAAAGQTDTAGAVADPSILRNFTSWVVFSTQRLSNGTATLNVPMQVSPDLSTWTNAGDALPTLPSWAVSGGTWAPSAIALPNGTYLLYFAARSQFGVECIGVATAAQPLGPFTSASPTPLTCQGDLGGSIDPDVYADGHGGLWLTWKNDGNSIGARDTLWSEPLSPDGLRLVGSPTALLSASAGWENGIVENPDLVTIAGTLYLFYSGGSYASADYATGYATCASPVGPCTDHSARRHLVAGSWASGNGSLSTFALADGRTGMAWSAWAPGQAAAAATSRSLYIGHIRIVGGVPELIGGLAPDPVAPPVTVAATATTAPLSSIVVPVAPARTGRPDARAATRVEHGRTARGSSGAAGVAVGGAVVAAAILVLALRRRVARRARRSAHLPRLGTDEVALVSRSVRQHAVGVLGLESHHRAPVVDHGAAVVVPVVVRAAHGRVEGDELLDGGIVSGLGHGGQGD